jgi:ribosomal protein S18 acetylase RimI-like enzyme
MKTIAIRPIEISEYDTVTALWKRSWESTGLSHPGDLSFQELRDRFEHEAAHSWDSYVAELNGEIAGLLALKIEDKQLDQLFIAPEYQGRGVGTALLQFAKQKLPSGMWLRTAERNTKAIAFYKAAGFLFEQLQARPEWDRNDAIYRWHGAR